MKWVTRANVKVDRVACPWLIRNFVDPEAEFLFVPTDQVDGVVSKTGAIPYDTSGAELGHHGEECSFDAIVKKYKVKDEAIDRVATIVRGADTGRPDQGSGAWPRPKATTITKPFAGSATSTMRCTSFAGAMPRSCARIEELDLQCHCRQWRRLR
jgi:hypothetical protein